MYKFFIFAPNEKELIKKIIDAASAAGAGKIGDYQKCAFVSFGYSTFLPTKESDPVSGEKGKFNRRDEVKIEMKCAEVSMKEVIEAIKKIHPYETVVIDAVLVERF